MNTRILKLGQWYSYTGHQHHDVCILLLSKNEIHNIDKEDSYPSRYYKELCIMGLNRDNKFVRNFIGESKRHIYWAEPGSSAFLGYGRYLKTGSSINVE